VSVFQATIGEAAYDRLAIITDITAEVRGGELTVILGSNGAGKSTTLRALMGTIRCAGRKLVLDGKDLSHHAPWQLPHHGVVFVPDGARCFPSLSVLENLRGARLAIGQPADKAEMERGLDQVYELFPVLRQMSSRPAGALSGGQRQMVAVGRALMVNPRVLILDEPSAGLAPKVVEEMFEALGVIKRSRDCGILMAEQNVGLASNIADRCLVLEQGRMVLSGAMDNVARDPKLRSAYLGL